MLGLMMDRPLTLPSILEHAALYHGDREVVTRTVEGPIHRYGYAQALDRAKRMAKALLALGVKPGDRVATLAWSTHRHFELYFAVTGIGARCTPSIRACTTTRSPGSPITRRTVSCSLTLPLPNRWRRWPRGCRA